MKSAAAFVAAGIPGVAFAVVEGRVLECQQEVWAMLKRAVGEFAELGFEEVV